MPPHTCDEERGVGNDHPWKGAGKGARQDEVLESVGTDNIRQKPERMYNKVYCLWEAPDIESVMEVIGKRHSSRESLSSSGFQARRSGGYNPRLVFGSLRPALAQ